VNGALFAAVLIVLARMRYPRTVERVHALRYPLRPDGIIVGAEPFELKRANAAGVLILHGGGDTPQSVRELASRIHARGFSVRVPLLARHGRSLRDFRHFNAAEWEAQVRSELALMAASHQSVSIVGQSLGGALALDAVASGADVQSLVLLAPWIAMSSALRLIAATSVVWGPLVPYLPSMGSQSIHDGDARSQTLTRGIVTPGGLGALATMAARADAALAKVHVPTLMMHSHQDHRIAPNLEEAAFVKLGASDKRFEWIDEAGHVLSVDKGRERVFAFTTDWLDAHKQ
jgi:carboxylesterase